MGVAARTSVTEASATFGSATDAPAPAAPATEDDLGRLLLALVASARSQGLDAERALRSAVRGLEDEVRSAEGSSDAGD